LGVDTLEYFEIQKLFSEFLQKMDNFAAFSRKTELTVNH